MMKDREINEKLNEWRKVVAEILGVDEKDLRIGYSSRGYELALHGDSILGLVVARIYDLESFKV
jgi:hypothetical protein